MKIVVRLFNEKTAVDKCCYNKQYVKSVTKFFGYGKESVIDNADFL